MPARPPKHCSCDTAMIPGTPVAPAPRTRSPHHSVIPPTGTSEPHEPHPAPAARRTGRATCPGGARQARAHLREGLPPRRRSAAPELLALVRQLTPQRLEVVVDRLSRYALGGLSNGRARRSAARTRAVGADTDDGRGGGEKVAGGDRPARAVGDVSTSPLLTNTPTRPAAVRTARRGEGSATARPDEDDCVCRRTAG